MPPKTHDPPSVAISEGPSKTARRGPAGAHRKRAGDGDATEDLGEIDMNMMTAIAASPTTDRAAWDAALAAFHSSIEAVAAAGADDDKVGRLATFSGRAEIALMMTPAPDGAAALEKLDICLKHHSSDIHEGGHLVWPAIRADLERLLGAQADQANAEPSRAFDFLESAQAFQINGCTPLVELGTEEFGEARLAEASAAVTMMEIATESEEFEVCNPRIIAAALRGIGTQIALGAHSLALAAEEADRGKRA